jgi:beta-glucosidase
VLAAFATARAAPGESVRVRLTIPARLFTRYNEELAAWIRTEGKYTVHIGRSSRDLQLSAAVQVTALCLIGYVPSRSIAEPHRRTAQIIYHRIIL